MKAPKRHVTIGGMVRWDPPDKEWLTYQYLTLEKSIALIKREIQAHFDTVAEWLRVSGVPRRTAVETQIIHARRVTGSNNPRWGGGYSAGYLHKLARRILEDAGVPEECSWCGQLPVPSKRGGGLEVHHKDHNRWHNRYENLCYLCVACHKVETGLWHLVKQGKIDLVAEGREMHITFRRK